MVSAPGHTANHVCVLVQDGDTTFLLAGDASYNETTMLDGKVDGVSPDEKISVAALRAIKHFARTRPTVYLPTHDPQAGDRLKNRQALKCGIALTRRRRDGVGTRVAGPIGQGMERPPPAVSLFAFNSTC